MAALPRATRPRSRNGNQETAMLSALFLLSALSVQATPQPEVEPALVTAIAESPADRKFRVFALMSESLGYEDLRAEVQPLPRGVRQRYVADRLRAFADATQGDLRARLTRLEAEGQVERVQELWILNGMVFHGTGAAIAEVAALDGVDLVGWDPPRAPEEYQDVRPAAVTYYSEGFESGSFGPEWSTSTTSCGRVQVTSQHGPATGSFHALMDSNTDACQSTASMTLTVDLSSATTVDLSFGMISLSDEFDLGLDIVEASDDGGASWVKVSDLSGSTSYLTKVVDMDALGLNYVAGFQLRFRWSDNYTAPTDGIGIDDILLTDYIPPPPPPGPEINLVQLQAPDLWNLGYNGQNVVLLNIDSGADYTHPDLANRVWSNPLDPADGSDNDGNGYVDDVMGWDFQGGDNDPYPSSSSHGTNTAGIMVGDGSAGLYLTGMAPGAQMAIARINGESDHWLAQQWGISVGIDCSSSSHSYKWYFSPKPHYHQHRKVEGLVLAAGIIHANSIGNDGPSSGSAPIPFNISAPGLCPSPWRHVEQTQPAGGVTGVMACGGINLDDTSYSSSGSGPCAWEDLRNYDPGYPFQQSPAWWDYPVGGFGGSGQGLLKPDIVTYTNVRTTTNGTGYVSSFGGTSAATPHLGGALALLISANPSAQPRHVAQAIQRTGIDLGAPGKDARFGAGKLQVKDAALRLFHLVSADDTNPSIGTTVTLTMTGTPGQAFVTGYGFALGSTTTAVGTLDLAAPVFVLTSGTLDAAGQSQLPIPIPNEAGIVGLEIHLQSVADDTAGPTAQWLLSVTETVTLAP
jgi:subtilisin family serine protease